MEPNIIDIQKFSLSDGEGIRTSIFFKGCGLSCRWCHNPESIHFETELFHNPEACVGCGRCVVLCKRNALVLQEKNLEVNRAACNGCGECSDCCVYSALEVTGTRYSVDQLIKVVEQDRPFYETSGGGVTLTGGECMLQDIDFLETLCSKLKKRGIHIACDTSGYAPATSYERLVSYIDIFLFDLKLMDSTLHKKYVGQSNELILSNLLFLSKHKAAINLRLPMIGGVNAVPEHLHAVADFLHMHEIVPVKINLLPYHNIGQHKYKRLGITYKAEDFHVPSAEDMALFQTILTDAGFLNVKIGA